MSRPLAPPDTTHRLLRRGVVWLGLITAVGVAVELAADRHWTQPVQLIAWAATALAVVALVLAARSTSSRAILVARILAGVVILSAVLGVWEHVESNYDAGELDFEYADRWESLSEPTRWWLALSKTVGPSPPLAPAALAQASICVLLATAGRQPPNRPE